MKKIFERLGLFFIGLPLILASILFFPFKNYLILQMEIIFFGALASLETRSLLGTKLKVHNKMISLLLGLSLPLSFIITIYCDNISFNSLHVVSVIFILILIIEFIYSFFDSLDHVIERVASSLFILVYPGLFFIYISKMTLWNNAGIILSLFLSFVFACDSIAWLFGNLFGKNNRGLVKASPNKSLVGFIGGYIGSILVAIIFYYCFPFVFEGALLKLLILAFFVATTAIIGDIIESILKRSAAMKDSGFIIPGRGGILDSIDSIIFSAPIFYILYSFLLDVFV